MDKDTLQEEIQEWRIAMRQQKLPHGIVHYYISHNLCPACHGKEVDCLHCQGQGTYSAYSNAIQNETQNAYRKTAERVLAMVELTKRAFNDRTVAQHAHAKLKTEVRELLNLIQAEIGHLDTKTNKTSLTKITSWLEAIQALVKEE